MLLWGFWRFAKSDFASKTWKQPFKFAFAHCLPYFCASKRRKTSWSNMIFVSCFNWKRNKLTLCHTENCAALLHRHRYAVIDEMCNWASAFATVSLSLCVVSMPNSRVYVHKYFTALYRSTISHDFRFSLNFFYLTQSRARAYTHTFWRGVVIFLFIS